MTQLGIDWNADVSLPVNGNTPAAKEASASGAHAAAVVFGSRISKVLAAFAKFQRLTIAQTADVTALKESSVCSVWARLERIGWIEGTREYFTYQAHGRTVYREFHVLTVDGKRAAWAQLQRRIQEVEAGR